jgi:hypothetical protein
MTLEITQRLRKLAAEAAQGERVTVDSVNNGKVYVCLASGSLSESLALCDSEANAAFIAALSPSLIIARVECVEAAEEWIDVLNIAAKDPRIGLTMLQAGALCKLEDALAPLITAHDEEGE